MTEPRHLHLDYSNSYCGKDISHLPATWNEKEVDCKACLKQVPVVLKQKADEQRATEAAEEKQRQEHRELFVKRQKEHAENERKRAAEQDSKLEENVARAIAKIEKRAAEAAKK